MGAVLAGQQTENRVPFLIDFSIRSASIPRVSYIDVLRGDEATLKKLAGKKVIIGGTALELGDRFSVPNGAVLSGPVLQALAAESILQNRTLRWTSDVVALIGLCIIALFMMWSWRRLSAGLRVVALVVNGSRRRDVAVVLQSQTSVILDTALFHTAIAAYLAAIALDEIDLRDFLGRIAESRFQRIAMSLGDGLVCTDSHRLITVWNPGATAIFGHLPEEMIGRPLDTICAGGAMDAFPALFSATRRRRCRRGPAGRGGIRGLPEDRRGVSGRGLLLRMAWRRRRAVWRYTARHLAAQT